MSRDSTVIWDGKNRDTIPNTTPSHTRPLEKAGSAVLPTVTLFPEQFSLHLIEIVHKDLQLFTDTVSLTKFQIQLAE